MTIGILAYGSLISDPGSEIGPLVVQRLATETPFPVEYVRRSVTRGGAPTVAPYSVGRPVNAEVLVLHDSVTVDSATDMLWRRERGKEGSGLRYKRGETLNSVLVEAVVGHEGVDTVLYTNFHEVGKRYATAAELAQAAISSVAAAAPGRDGITYLTDLIDRGVITALTEAYRNEVLKVTGAGDLKRALEVSRSRGPAHP